VRQLFGLSAIDRLVQALELLGSGRDKRPEVAMAGRQDSRVKAYADPRAPSVVVSDQTHRLNPPL